MATMMGRDRVYYYFCRTRNLRYNFPELKLLSGFIRLG